MLVAVGLSGFVAGGFPSPGERPKAGQEWPTRLAPSEAAAAMVPPSSVLAPKTREGSADTTPAFGIWRISVPQRRPADLAQEFERPTANHEFYFTRAVYTSGRFGRSGRYGRWATDYPKSDRQFMVGVKRLTFIDGYPMENPVRLNDPDLRRYPFLYALEVGSIALTPAEEEGLRDYLLAGGFLVVDDFWGSYQWANFEAQMRRIFPNRSIVELPITHEVFSAFYNIEELLQVPAVTNWMYNGRTWEQDGYVPHARGIFDDDGRLMVVINWNTDLGDAWEWAENPYYPLQRSTFAYEMGINFIIYAMSH
jgi:hypothetical protein